MQPPSWTEFLHCCVCISKFDTHTFIPVSLSCGHTLCSKCLAKLNTQICPYDKNPIGPLVESLPKNYAILQLLEDVPSVLDERYTDLVKVGVADTDRTSFLDAMEALDKLAHFLLPLADQTATSNPGSHLTKPMLRKLVSIVTCQALESEGRVRILRAARSIADRTVTELLVMHQNQQQLSTQLWTAVKNRGCQFLGPVMQEEALKLVLMVLQSGKFMARKTIVLYVVQKLLQDFPQASKTSVGHVVQLLYRASCFNVEKREDDSSLMQLKEEFRSYELLRREHDAQIIRMAMEAGLRISPEQWSSLLYGIHKHKSDMQSIIDKLISQGATSSGLSELIIAIGRSQDPYNLSEKIVPHLEILLRSDITNNEKCTKLAGSWSSFSEYMHALHHSLQGFSTFMQIQSGRFKTGLCPNLSRPEGCPRGDKCTYAHTEEERELYRSLSKGTKPPKARTEPVKMVGVSTRQGTRGRHSGDFGPPISDLSMYSYLPSQQVGVTPIAREPHYLRQGSGEGSFDSGSLSGGFPFTDGQLLSLQREPDPSLGVIQQPPPTKPAQYYPPSQIGYPPPPPQYHTIPVVTAPHQYMYGDSSRGVVSVDQSYYNNQVQHAGVVRPKSYSEEKPYQDPNYQGYINNPGPPNQLPLTKQYSDDVRRLDDYAGTRDENTWSKYDQEDEYSKFEPETQLAAPDPLGLERSTSLSPYPSNQSFPRGSSPTPSKHEDADTIPLAVTSSLESVDSDRELELRMANLKLAKTLPDTTMYYPLTSAVITNALSRTHVTLEPVHEHQPESYQPMPGSHSTLSYPNSEFKYPPQTTQAHSYVNIESDVRTVASQRIDPIPSVSRGNEDLRERRARLEQELRMVEMEEHHQQQTVNRWSGPKNYPPVGTRVPYESGGGASPHHSGLVGQLPSYGGSLQYHTGGVQPQYSPHNSMTHQYLPQQPQMREYQHATPGASSLPHAGIYYSPQPTPTPHQWSAPINTHSAGYVAPLQQRGYVIQPQAPAAAPLMIQPSRVDSSDDGMIAAYLQSLEQEKAFQQQQRYTSPLNQGAMGMYPPGTLPPRQPYPGTYKYTY